MYSLPSIDLPDGSNPVHPLPKLFTEAIDLTLNPGLAPKSS